MKALLEDGHCLLSMISALKMELKDVQNEFDSLSKSIILISLGTQSLNYLLSKEKIKIDKKES